MELIGQKVFVYWDLHRKCFSLKSLKTGKVLNYLTLNGRKQKVAIDHIVLSSCEFRVNQKGRWKVVETGVKNVHAGVVGTVKSVEEEYSIDGKDFRPVRYNPKQYNTFVWSHNSRPVYESKMVIMTLDRRVVAL